MAYSESLLPQRTLLSAIGENGEGACKFKCKYCYASEPSYCPTFSVYSPATVETLENNADRYDTLVPSCDTEFFQNPQAAIHALRNLVPLGKDITFPTKMLLGKWVISHLQDIQRELMGKGNILSVMVSIPMLDRSGEIEIGTPSPARRAAQVKTLSEAGLFPYVALRPLLPPKYVSNDEIGRIVDMTVDNSEGYITGPYWFKTDTLGLLQDPLLPIKRRIVDWMDDPEEWYLYMDREREQSIVDLIKSRGGQHFRKTPELMKRIKSKLEESPSPLSH